jgi:hypothetical protein
MGTRDPRDGDVGSSRWERRILVMGTWDPRHGDEGSSPWGRRILVMGTRDPRHGNEGSSPWGRGMLVISMGPHGDGAIRSPQSDVDHHDGRIDLPEGLSASHCDTKRSHPAGNLTPRPHPRSQLWPGNRPTSRRAASTSMTSRSSSTSICRASPRATSTVSDARGERGASGRAISFCDHDEQSLLRDVERLIRRCRPAWVAACPM